VKEFLKSVKISQSYCQKFRGLVNDALQILYDLVVQCQMDNFYHFLLLYVCMTMCHVCALVCACVCHHVISGNKSLHKGTDDYCRCLQLPVIPKGNSNNHSVH